MPIVVQAPSGTKLLEETQTAIVGRDKTVDVVINSSRVSRHHLRIEFDGNRWTITDLDSSNGSFVNSQPFRSRVVENTEVIHLGNPDGPEIVLTVTEARLTPMESAVKTTAVRADEFKAMATELISLTKRASLKPRTRIGRDDQNDIVFADDLMVSRVHCEVVQNSDGKFDLIDLKSANGTYVNGLLIRRHRLEDGDTVSVGNHSMVFSKGALEPIDDTSGFEFTAQSIGLVISGKRLLSDVSFELKPGSLTAVVGPSGSGKSTLLSVLSGQRQPSEGSVYFAGRELHQHFNELRNRIGLVPQADLLHTNLKTRRALAYGAALRLPRDTTPIERQARVDEVMADLGLTARADLRIDKLSGGQRKRASVALELITDPELLFLDEPTSGLDPGLDRQVMNMLRELADAGRTVVIVTHSTANLDICDDVVVMAAGGTLAYFGSPHGVTQAFGSDDWADVFENLEVGAPRRGAGTSPMGKRPNRETVEFAPRRRQSWFFQLFQLMKRYVEVISSDRAYLALAGTLPMIIGLVALLTGSDAGLGIGSEDDFELNPEARSTLLTLILGAVFMGMSLSIQEIVKERVIYQRERSTGLSPSAYIISKFLVLTIIGGIQSSLFVSVALAGRDLPEKSLLSTGPFFSILMTVAALTVVSLAVGLFLSTLATTPEVAMPILVVATMAQVVLSGAVPLINEDILEWSKWINPAYWGMNSLANLIDLNSLSFLDDADYVQAWGKSLGSYRSGMVGVLSAMLIALIGSVASLKKSSR